MLYEPILLQEASPGMARNRLLILLLVGVLFLFFAAYSFFILRLAETIPDLEIVLSLPTILMPGTDQEIALYSLDQQTRKPVSGLAFELRLRRPHPGAAEGMRILTTEKQPGCHVGRITLPSDHPSGEYSLSVSLPGRDQAPFGGVPMRIEDAPCLAVIPPRNQSHCGDTLVFSCSAFQSGNGVIRPYVPIRAKVSNPEGIEMVNRIVSTGPNGRADFSFQLHPEASTGTYRIQFVLGRRRQVFHLPVGEAPSPETRLIQDLSSTLLGVLGERIIPRMNLFPDTLPQEQPLSLVSQQQPGFRAEITQSNQVRIDFSAPIATGTVELWYQGSLSSASFLTRASMGLDLDFRRATTIPIPLIPRPFPILARIWQKKDNGYASDEFLIHQDGRETPLREVFQRISDQIFPGPLVLSQLQAPLPGWVHGFPAVIRPSILGNHLQRLAEWILFLFPFILGIGLAILLWTCPTPFPPEDASHQALLNHLATALVLYGCFMAGFRYSRTMDNMVSLISLIGFASLTLFWVTNEGLRTRTRLTGSFLLMGTYMVFLLCLGKLYVTLDLESFLLGPSSALLFLSGISVPVFFAITGILHLEDLPRRILNRGLELGNTFLWPLAGTGWRGTTIQLLLLSLIFYLLFTVPQWFALPSVSLLPTTIRSATNVEPKIFPPMVTMEFGPRETLIGEAPDRETVPPPPMPTTSQASPTEPLICPISAAPLPRSRFFLMTSGLNLQTRRAQKITVFQNEKDFWTRMIAALENQPLTLSNLTQRIQCRVQRFPFLAPTERAEETMAIEALIGVLSRFILHSLRDSSTIPWDRNIPLEGTLRDASRIVAIDPVLTVHARNWETGGEAGPLPGSTGEIPLPLLEGENPNADLRLTPDQFHEAFHSGGDLILIGPHASMPFPIKGESVVLTRGSSFREDFDLKRLEVHRSLPLLVEVQY